VERYGTICLVQGMEKYAVSEVLQGDTKWCSSVLGF
jgi:hypothetical protein